MYTRDVTLHGFAISNAPVEDLPPDMDAFTAPLLESAVICGREHAQETQMAWIWLTLAGLLEIVWAVGLKYTEGFTRLVPSVVTGAAMVASMYLLAMAVRTIPIGTGYAVWTGIGAVGVAILGMVLFGEPRDIVRVASIVLIVAGIAGLKLFSPS